MIVIPAINAASREEAEAQFKKIAPLAKSQSNPRGAELIHLDIADGKFAPRVTWGSPANLKNIVASGYTLVARFEVHLMVQNPEAAVGAWLATGLVKRIIVHVEAMTDREAILSACEKYGAEAMLAIAPETPAERVMNKSARGGSASGGELGIREEKRFRALQVLAVPPGKAGQPFLPETLEKIRVLRVKFPRATIEVDGGITPQTAQRCAEAGADTVVSASYILRAADPLAAFQELQSFMTNF